MFIKAKIRGIPLYKLAKSELLPQIKTLANLWKNINRDNPIKQAKPIYASILLAWSLTILGFLMLFIKSLEGSRGAGLWVLAMGCFTFAMNVITQPWKFVKAVRRLDQCLDPYNGGIPKLPHTGVEMETFLQARMAYTAYLVLHYEQKEGRESESAEKWRLRIKDLGLIAQEFGFNLGPHAQYYEQAAARLAREKTSADPVPLGAS